MIKPRPSLPTLTSMACRGQMWLVRVIHGNDIEADTKRELKANYREFLDLTLDIETYSPLTFSVGHRIHGLQMRTGWPRQPTTVRSRKRVCRTRIISRDKRLSKKPLLKHTAFLTTCLRSEMLIPWPGHVVTGRALG